MALFPKKYTQLNKGERKGKASPCTSLAKTKLAGCVYWRPRKKLNDFIMNLATGREPFLKVNRVKSCKDDALTECVTDLK